VDATDTLTESHEEPSSTTGRRPVLIVVGSAEDLGAGGRVVPIGARLTIGRRDEPEHLSLDDPLVSASHALLVNEASGVSLADLGSRNGTYVNGLRLVAPVRLAGGDVVFIGAHALVFRLVSEDELCAIAEEAATPLGPVPTASAAVAVLCRRLRKLAPSPMELLLTGETGVGKEVLARSVHRLSGRTGQFFPINCAALPRDLVESELFGFTRGAHSQATRAKAGLVQLADGGTLFLDEIAETTPDVQAKLLRFLQTLSYTPLGAVGRLQVDVRVLAATNREVGGPGSALRTDLAARLGSHPMNIPPLRRRIEDLGRLAAHHLRPGGPRRLRVSDFRRLCLHRWPGNVRQLGKVIEEASIIAAGGEQLLVSEVLGPLPSR
jgi:transcriptional regulator of aromatic amino acid metabolism